MIQRIKYEQDKRNAKAKRQKLNRQRRAQSSASVNNASNSNLNPNSNQNHNISAPTQILAQGPIQNEMQMLYNTSIIAQNIDEFKYTAQESISDVQGRLKRAHKLVCKGKYKKGNDALDPGTIADLYINGNDAKNRKKFPRAPSVNISSHPRASPKWRLDTEKVVKLVKAINSGSCGGPIGINNAPILWIIEREERYHLGSAINRITKHIVTKGMGGVIRDLMEYAKGLPLGKEKNGVPNFDIRPVVIMDSVIKILRKVSVNNVEVDVRKNAEVATLCSSAERSMIATTDGESLVNLDATNAYNSMDRQQICNNLITELPDLYQWCLFLYGKEHTVDFTCDHRIIMQQGLVQGLCSSELFCGMGKWQIIKAAERRMVQKQPQFRVSFQTDYIDDGLQMIKYQYVPEYLRILKEEYAKWNIQINKQKTNIVLCTNNPVIKQYVSTHLSEYKYNLMVIIHI